MRQPRIEASTRQRRRQQHRTPHRSRDFRLLSWLISSCVLLFASSFRPPSATTIRMRPRFLHTTSLLRSATTNAQSYARSWAISSSSTSSSRISFLHRSFHRTSRLRMSPPSATIPFLRGNLLDAMDEESKRRLSTVANGDDAPPPSYTEYEKWVRRLYMTNLFHPAKLDLRNMQQLYQLMGKPLDQPNISVIHIAGTNGKGSVSLKIAKTLELSGPNVKVGLFCSPHVASFRERMQVNGELISEEEVVDMIPAIYQLCEDHDIPATFFEITTALAFQFYAKRGVSYVVLEAGLGGRLDATNVIANPALTIITSIGLEHTKILGDTIEKIALEKGGIIKQGRPILVGPKCPHDVLQACAIEKGASAYYTCDTVLHDAGTETATTTDYDIENSRLAQAAIALLKDMNLVDSSLSHDTIVEGTSQRPPCRFELIKQEGGPQIVLDVAHNPPAMEYLVHKLHASYPDAKFRVVIGMSSDKDLTLNASLVLQVVNQDPSAIHLVEAAHPRAAKLEHIFEAQPLLTSSHYDRNDRSVEQQVHSAMELAKQNNEILVVCGSVFLMAAAREALGFDEPRDSQYIAEVAGAGFRHGQENFANMNPDNNNTDNGTATVQK